MTDMNEDETGAEGGSRKDVWVRGLFMVVFAICFALAETLLHFMTLVQFLWLLIASARNEFLTRFGASLAVWMADVARFQTCNTEEKPFPWREWPSAAGGDG